MLPNNSKDDIGSRGVSYCVFVKQPGEESKLGEQGEE